ncbi:MAG: hypothetical protein AAGC60_18055 [Acidobacteriota bacterium]
MDASIVFRKTPEGEIETSSPRLELDTLGRQLLVLIDGRRAIGDLTILLSGQGDVPAMLFELLRQGLITTGGGATPATQPTGDPYRPSMADTWPGVAVQGAAPQPQPVAPQPAAPQPAAPQPAAPQPAAPQPAAPPQPVAPQPAAPQPAAPQPAAAQPPPVPSQQTASGTTAQRLEDTKLAILREVREVFGRDGDPVAAKLRACRSFGDLRILVTRIRQIAVDYAGRDAAEQFTATAFRQIELGEQP